MLDADGLTTSWNSGAQRMTGYTADEVIGKHFSRFYPAEDRESGPERALNTAREEGRFVEEAWRIREDGTRFWASIVIDAIYDENKEFIGFANVIRDMSEREHTRQALAASEQQFKLLVQSVVDYAIFMLDSEGRVSTWNPGAQRIKGYTPAEIIGHHFSRFFTSEDRQASLPKRALAAAAQHGKFEMEGWRVRKDGTRFWASVVIDAIHDETGRLIGFAKIIRDITERKKAQEALDEARAALLQSQKMEAIGQLTGGVAHDFNNLLTVIESNADLLANPNLSELQRRKLINGIQRAAERGAQLTHQLLAFARRQPLRPQILDINKLIGGFEAVLRRACGDMTELEFDLSLVSACANIDGTQFEAALLNLIVNARDAMPRGGKLRIRTTPEDVNVQRPVANGTVTPGRYIVVSVHDAGEGMTPEVKTRAFEPFYTTKETGRGSGLGLSQVYGFVAQSGGYVNIESAVGVGTTISLYLPLVSEVEETRSARPSQARTPRLSAGTVLVVEDDPDVMESAVATLKMLGYDVLTAGDGLSALDTLRRGQPIDVLFTDVVMPRGMSGVELARAAIRLRPGLKVLLASGYPTSVLSAEHGHIDEFSLLTKPYRWAELAERLRAARTAQGRLASSPPG